MRFRTLGCERGYVVLADAAAALLLTLAFAIAVASQSPPNAFYYNHLRSPKYELVASNVVLVAESKGFMSKLVHAFLLGEDTKPILCEILAICPKSYSCGVALYSGDSIVASVGCFDQVEWGEVRYLMYCLDGNYLVLVCRVGV